ncbi:hypothetical protein ACN28C_06060 [Plantactinospora sp. WMMC1484]|uniref:hypothetical protein n=1 Tax=Plantactinospora sp. WMMC1484 TaxID=3404122 RepID=UPI003BF5A7D7
MRSRVAGLWQVRGGPLAATVIVVALLFTVSFPELSLSVSVVFDLPPRGVGTPEIVAVALASVLPAITVPRFDGRELTARLSARLGHLAYSVAALAAPLAVLPIWYWTITARHPDEQFPPLHGLIGNVVAFSCVGAMLCLALGPLASAVVTPALFAGFVVAQHAVPDSVLTGHFATGRSWHTNYWVTTALALLTLAFTWWLRGIPRPERP